MTSLAHGSLHGASRATPAPALTFAEHRAGIVALAVVGRAVVSVDRDRVALHWDARTGAVLARHALPADALLASVFVAHDGTLAYVTDALAIRAADGRELARFDATVTATHAACTPDLARLLVARDGELTLLSRTAAPVTVTVESHEPEVLAMCVDGDGFRVRFHHVAMDMYPTDDEALYDGVTLRELRRERRHIDVRAPLPQLPVATVAVAGTVARIALGGRPLPDLDAHGAIVVTAWLDDTALLTADDGGTIHRWDVDLAAPLEPTQHAHAITAVRFTAEGALSFTAQDAKLWRGDALVATLPAFTAPLVDEARVIDVGPAEIRAYALTDGAPVAAHRPAPGHATTGPRGRLSVGLADAFPIRIVSPESGERTLPVDGIVSETAPPIVHAGRLLLSCYTAPTRSLALDTLDIVAERHLHEHGACWTALAPDGVTLYSAGYADGCVAASDFATLVERRRWRVFDANTAIKTAVLLARRGQVVVAGPRRVRRLDLGTGATRECTTSHDIEALVADAAEARVIVVLAGTAPCVLDVATMTWMPADIAPERGATTVPADGFDKAFACGAWLVGWSRGLAITPVSLAGEALRAPFSTRMFSSTSAARAVLVDDTRAELWLLGRDGALARTSLTSEAPVELVATFPGAAKLAWVTPSTFAVHDERGSLHYVATTGERICTIDQLASPQAPHALAASAAACAMPDGSVRVAAIPGDRVTLRDPRATVAATALALAPPFLASRHGNLVLRWDLRTATATGAWTASTTLTAIDVRADGDVLAGESNGTVTHLT